MLGSDSKAGSQPRTVEIALAIAALIFALAPLAANDYQLHVLTVLLINAMLAVSLNLVMGYLGQLSLANAAVFGFGAYTAAILVTRFALPYPIAVAAAATVGAAVNGLVALPALRLKGFFLAIATLTFGVFAHWLFLHGGEITAGASGLAVPKPDFSAVGLESAHGTYLLTLLAVVCTVSWTSRLVGSPFGRRSLCISEQELIAPTLGIDVVAQKLKVFMASGAISGVAGAMLAAVLGLVDPESFNLLQVIVQFMMVVLGGLGSILGALTSAVLVTWLTEALRAFKGLHEIVLGAALLGVILMAPRGLYLLASTRWPGLLEARSGGSALRGMGWAKSADRPARGEAIRPDPAAGQGPALRVSLMRKTFGGVVAVDSVSFDVRAGSVHALIGPNGSGKSTVLNLISGTLRPDSGRIEIFGGDATNQPGHRIAAIGVGRTFQNLQLVGELTVLENVMLGADAGWARRPDASVRRSLRTREAELAASAMQALEFVGMADFALRKGTELSGGQMRLVEIARANAAKPRLLLLDEPVAGLSLNRIDTVRSLILRINRELGVTVLLVEHVLNLVLEVSDQVTVLSAGKVLASGTPDQIRNDVEVQSAYLGRRAFARPVIHA
ncbi:MAG: hypothetical protein A3G81_23725 [Betaproteobacteria bacterium RIFCSPLOWO2_12_FULL_65_14]|nr:MAG: hypothetical protein A3G81_23725 [Betaproteobacteria bacterium RIFCSPLOWO2_12_FULL_65_14]